MNVEEKKNVHPFRMFLEHDQTRETGVIYITHGQ